AKQFTKELNIPLLVHIGNAPPYLDEIADQLEQGDIITHIYNDKLGNNMFTSHSSIQPALQNAIKRGVYFDVGHGTASFSFEIAKQALQQRIPLHSISTDIYNHNRINGPVYNMATTLNKFLALGYSLENVIQYITENPAKI